MIQASVLLRRAFLLDTIASIALLFSSAVTPNLLGQTFIVAQAIVPGALAELQCIGLRRSGGAVAI
jgi:hypothetical protein